jgi:Tfp pilus assembly protein PilW
MIVVIVILSIVSVITIKFLVDSMKIYTMTVNQKTLYDEGKLALERMCRDIRDAQSITSPTPGTSANAITFTRTHATAQDIVNESITFNLSGSNLQKVKASPAPGTTATMASNVTTFTVTCGVPPTVDTNYMITLYLYLSLTSGENVTLQTIVYPKNRVKDLTYLNFYQQWMEAYQ